MHKKTAGKAEKLLKLIVGEFADVKGMSIKK